jgi:hypothetical protein
MAAPTIRQGVGGHDILFVNAGAADFRPVEKWDDVASSGCPRMI